MNKSYLNSQSELKNYSQSETYITPTLTTNKDIYRILPEEYDIFSNIESKHFNRDSTLQEQLLSKFLTTMKISLQTLLDTQGVVKVLPKLSLTVDEEDAIILNWAYNNYRIYFNFEKDNSYYGAVAIRGDSDFSSISGELTIRNLEKVILRVLKYVVENS